MSEKDFSSGPAARNTINTSEMICLGVKPGVLVYKVKKKQNPKRFYKAYLLGGSSNKLAKNTLR